MHVMAADNINKQQKKKATVIYKNVNLLRLRKQTMSKSDLLDNIC
jgi:hypothetical protein